MTPTEGDRSEPQILRIGDPQTAIRAEVWCRTEPCFMSNHNHPVEEAEELAKEHLERTGHSPGIAYFATPDRFDYLSLFES